MAETSPLLLDDHQSLREPIVRRLRDAIISGAPADCDGHPPRPWGRGGAVDAGSHRGSAGRAQAAHEAREAETGSGGGA